MRRKHCSGVALPTMAAHPQAAKLRLTDGLPRQAGVYLFRDGAGRTLYVGKATDLRARVRSYFSGDDRRKVGALLREVQRIDHVVCPSPLEAAVLEVRLIHRLEPRFNRQATTWRRYAYLKLTVETFPRLSIVRTVRDDGALYLGPLSSAKVARRVADAIETAVPIRRCTEPPDQPPPGCDLGSLQGVKWALLFALGGTGAVIVAACVLVLLTRHRLSRLHRVDRSVPTGAPLTWLVDPRQPARLHRRLTKVGRTATTIAEDHRPPSRRLRRRTPPLSPIAEAAEGVRAQAVAADMALTRLAVLAPTARRRPVAEVACSVDALETAAARLVALSAEVRSPLVADGNLDPDVYHPGLLDVTAQVDRLARAHQALLDLDAQAGLSPQRLPAPPLVQDTTGR